MLKHPLAHWQGAESLSLDKKDWFEIQNKLYLPAGHKFNKKDR